MLTRTASVLLALLVAAPASGLENIQNVYWFLDVGQYVPGRNVSLVSFDATLTGSDVSTGLTYTIVERDENGGPAAPIWHFVLEAYPELPAAGTPVNILAAFEFSCDPEGRLLPIEATVTTYMSACTADTNTANAYVLGVGNGSMGSAFPVEAYEFGLMDEHGILASTTTPPNAYTPCVAVSGAAASTEADLLERMAEFRRSRLNASEKPGDSGSVGLYFDAEGTICSGTIQPGVPQKIYVIAKTRGFTDCGIAGAEFRFTGIPQSWQVNPVAGAGVVAFGNPLTEGTTLGMPCQNPESGQMILYEVDVLASQLEADVTFRLEPHVNPVGSFSCPLLVLCDSPFYTQICVESIPCHFNPASPKGCDGTVAVQLRTWSAVKELYR